MERIRIEQEDSFTGNFDIGYNLGDWVNHIIESDIEYRSEYNEEFSRKDQESKEEEYDFDETCAETVKDLLYQINLLLGTNLKFIKLVEHSQYYWTPDQAQYEFSMQDYHLIRNFTKIDTNPEHKWDMANGRTVSFSEVIDEIVTSTEWFFAFWTRQEVLEDFRIFMFVALKFISNLDEDYIERNTLCIRKEQANDME